MNKTRSQIKSVISEKPYIQLLMGNNTSIALSMTYTQEVFTIERKKITPIPNMADCVVGLLNQRNHVFWVVDLAAILNLGYIDRDRQQYHLVIVRVNNIPLGIIVPQIVGVIRLDREKIRSPVGNVDSNLVPYLQGCYLQEKKILLVLDAEAIINSPLLK